MRGRRLIEMMLARLARRGPSGSLNAGAAHMLRGALDSCKQALVRAMMGTL